ncbi:MAG: hypothetical protein AB7P02_00045 [Alphaproteobacteria bacterium]
MERARALARRKEIYEIRHPETRQHVAGAAAKHGRANDKMSFAAETAKKTGRDESSVRRSVRIGERLSPEAEEAAKA